LITNKNNLVFCISLVWYIFVSEGFAADVSVPGTWYDQDNYHFSTEITGGENDGENSWKYNLFYDSDGDGVYDAGEACSFTFGNTSSEYEMPNWKKVQDNSCWIAVASNLARYSGGGNWYDYWAFTNGVNGQTFVDEGNVKDALNILGYSTQSIQWNGIKWTDDPTQWIQSHLQNGIPVSVGLLTSDSSHAITVYAIDTGNNTITYADNDGDRSTPGAVSPVDYLTVSYSYDGYDFKIQAQTWRSPAPWDEIYGVTSIDPTGHNNTWQGSGTGGNTFTSGSTVKWTTPGNWDIGHAPIPNDDVFLNTTNSGKVVIDCDAKGHTITVDGPAPLELGSGYSLTATGMAVGYESVGAFNHAGGSLTLSDTLYVGWSGNSGVNGTYNLSGTGDLRANNESIGDSGTGAFSQANGSNAVSGNLYIGRYSRSAGTYNLSGGSLSVGGNMYVSNQGAGILSQSGGSAAVTGTTYIGSESGTRGAYSLQNGTFNTDVLVVGRNGQGTFTQDAGTVTDRSAIVGQSSGDDNCYNQNGGTHVVSQELDIAVAGNSRGTYILNGGILALQGIQKGSGVAAFNFGGGTLQANASFATNIPMTLAGVNGNPIIDTNSFNLSLSGLLTGNGGLEKQGAGILTLSADNNYTGTTTINSGTLALDASGQIDQSEAINNNAIFEIIAGTHNVTNIVGNGTTIADAGTLTANSIFQGALTIGAGACIVISPIPGGPLADMQTMNAVPEPSTCLMLMLAAMGLGILTCPPALNA
jgi:autotransporter-associated beta strand protein